MVRVGLSTSILLTLAACQAGRGPMMIESRNFGLMPDGGAVTLVVLRNISGTEVSIMAYGATVVSLKVPDRDGTHEDVVLGFDSFDGYLGDNPYFGAIVGRYGNRIANGLFELDGKSYSLVRNNGPNHLHGGLVGFDKVLWGVQAYLVDDSAVVAFTYESVDGEEGYPGTLQVTVTYTLTVKDELIVDYEATADKATPINLTQHSYFNLSGAGRGDILGHELFINASAFTPVDSTLIPTGEIRSVAGTPFDFKSAHTAVGARIADLDSQLVFGRGYDHNYVLDGSDEQLALAASVYEPTSGRVMEVFTTEPGIQLYTGNFLDGSIVGKGGQAYGRNAAFCLETQHYPDSPNRPEFPSSILRPGEQYSTRTVFAFSSRPGR